MGIEYEKDTSIPVEEKWKELYRAPKTYLQNCCFLFL